MEIEWRPGPSDDIELWLGDVNMGWVDKQNYVHCMWMTYRDEGEDPRDHLLNSQYPEDHEFKTTGQAQDALLESAVPIYIGGFRGR